MQQAARHNENGRSSLEKGNAILKVDVVSYVDDNLQRRTKASLSCLLQRRSYDQMIRQKENLEETIRAGESHLPFHDKQGIWGKRYSLRTPQES